MFDADSPIIYSCSGCSSAAQMANYIAVKLDRMGIAEMSCIVGVGGNVKKLVKTAHSGRKLVVIDGCPLACGKACLKQQGLEADMHIDLSKEGIKKKQHEDFDLGEATQMLYKIKNQILDMQEYSSVETATIFADK